MITMWNFIITNQRRANHSIPIRKRVTKIQIWECLKRLNKCLKELVENLQPEYKVNLTILALIIAKAL